MKRHLHNLGHYHLTTMDLGKLYPVSCVEVAAGDVWRHSSSALIRSAPLVAPVMHPVQAKLHHWFVPFRLLWDGWEQFITGGADGLGGSAGAYPTITAGGGGFAAKSLPDFLQVPPSVANLVIGAMPVRAYNLIWNEYYRDRDLNTALTVPTTSGADATSPLVIQSACWEKDYFTSSRPWAQKGPAVSIPLGTSAPVITSGSEMRWSEAAGANPTAIERSNSVANSAPQLDAAGGASGARMYWLDGAIANLAGATASTVTALREAFALQRYQEARAMYGDRYVEYLRYYGIKPSDGRLQRPEYLGGGKTTITFSEVLQTSDNGAVSGVGDMYGHGIAALKTRPYARFFEEHGVVLSLLVVRPVAMYQHGLHRMHQRRIKEDYYTPELELIGQQEVLRREVWAEAGAGGDTIFGYQDRYREYCEHPSAVSSEMRGTLDFWHMARQFAAAPALNAAFVNIDMSATNERRNWQGGTTGDPLWVFVNHNIRARRFVRRNPGARII